MKVINQPNRESDNSKYKAISSPKKRSSEKEMLPTDLKIDREILTNRFHNPQKNNTLELKWKGGLGFESANASEKERIISRSGRRERVCA